MRVCVCVFAKSALCAFFLASRCDVSIRHDVLGKSLENATHISYLMLCIFAGYLSCRHQNMNALSYYVRRNGQSERERIRECVCRKKNRTKRECFYVLINIIVSDMCVQCEWLVDGVQPAASTCKE